MKRLIVNADDFGYTRSVNLGIVRVFLEGIVTSTTIMANGAAFNDAVEHAKANPELGIGCHLVLVGGQSVAAAKNISSLADAEGNLPATLPVLVKKLSAGAIKPEEIAVELRAQISKAISAGIQPTHLDSHKHTHSHPRVMEQVARVAEEFGIRRIRKPFEDFGSLIALAFRNGSRWWSRNATAILAHAAAPAFRRIIHDHHLVTPEHFWGVAATGTLNRGAILSMISSMPEGVSELMCHPGHCDRELEQSNTRLKQEREWELEALIEPGVRAALKQQHVELISYRGLN
jgi:hopanoid biosynthesis associated protein HpnK